jgi:hypothetical protein
MRSLYRLKGVHYAGKLAFIFDVNVFIVVQIRVKSYHLEYIFLIIHVKYNFSKQEQSIYYIVVDPQFLHRTVLLCENIF